MERWLVVKKDGKARATNLVQVEDGYILHSSYDLRLLSQTEITETGHLKVFELIPCAKDLPGFVGRWDQKANWLDVDPAGPDLKTPRLFRAGKSGYLGHRPQLVSSSPRRFKVDIRIPGMEVFSGVVTFGLRRDLALNVPAKIAAQISPKVIRRPEQEPDG